MKGLLEAVPWRPRSVVDLGLSTTGMVCAFTPSGVMVACKVLPTPESPYDVFDFVA